MILKRWKFCLEPLCVQYCSHSSLHQELPWFVISNTRLQHWRALHAQLVLLFWISDSALGCKTLLLTCYGFGAFQYTEENFFLVTLYIAMRVLLWFHRHVCPALHQGACVCAKVGILMAQKFLLKNHPVYLCSKTSLCACVKSFFSKIETYFNARFMMACICIGDVINNFSRF